MVILEPPEHRWHCPACGDRTVTRRADVHTQFHQCPALRGVLAPYLPESVTGVLRVNEREDYVRDEIVQTDADGRPAMSVTVTREDGEDCFILAPTARGLVHVSDIA